MISPKKLIKMEKKWQKLAAGKRKRISFARTTMVPKCHFIVYTTDQQRFVIPLKYLQNNIISELFRIAEDEFGSPSSERITLPCDAVFLEYVVSLIRRHAAKDVAKALLMSLSTTGRCLPYSYLHQEQDNQQSLICSF